MSPLSLLLSDKAVAVVVYLGLAVFFFVDPLWIERVRRRVRSQS
jgi:hypothetical protein